LAAEFTKQQLTILLLIEIINLKKVGMDGKAVGQARNPSKQKAEYAISVCGHKRGSCQGSRKGEGYGS
jgi:hypothetical protein